MVPNVVPVASGTTKWTKRRKTTKKKVTVTKKYTGRPTVPVTTDKKCESKMHSFNKNTVAFGSDTFYNTTEVRANLRDSAQTR